MVVVVVAVVQPSPAYQLFLNSPRDVDSAEPRLKQGFFPFLLFFLERPTAGWNCSSRRGAGEREGYRCTYVVYRSR